VAGINILLDSDALIVKRRDIATDKPPRAQLPNHSLTAFFESVASTR